MALTRIDIELTEHQLRRSLVADAARGLLAATKVLPPKYFYDQRGSELFERITLLPEYYPTRAERTILLSRSDEIVSAASAATSLVELGSGSSTKTPFLLDAMIRLTPTVSYVPVDVSLHALVGAVGDLREAYPLLPIHGVVKDFEQPLESLPGHGRRLLALLGSTIGNLGPEARARFFANVASALAPGESLLLGVDLVKEPQRLVDAYNDAAGVTQLFNLNMLNVLNRLLTADFDTECFDHVAVWDGDNSRVEMRLRARKGMKVRLLELETTIAIEEGEEIRTEISTKFQREGLERELSSAGLDLCGWWEGSDDVSGEPARADYAVALAVRT